MPTAATGRILAGRYRLISELGVGGMGVTYRAWDDDDAVPVVVKMPKREAQSDEEALRRFAREIDAMLALPHEHIVPITDHGDDDGCPYVVMRFLPGGSLADHRRRDDDGNPLANPAGMLHFWLPAIAEALDFMHQRGMLHRDVKPGNIFFDGFWNAFLGDFGIAKVVDSSGGLAKEQTLTATMVAIGTPEYMAPELFSPKAKPDGRADQYALAVTVYEMLCGVRPFTGSKAHIVVEHSSMQVPPLQNKGLKLPQSLCAAVERALAKTPEDRFGTCAEFVRVALRDVTPLIPEQDITRLLCPGCKNLLKLPQKAAGRTGKCPKCREPIDVAEDLGSLWLKSEERGAGTTTDKQSLLPLDEPLIQASKGDMWRWGMVALATCIGLALGYAGGAVSQRSEMQAELTQAESQWRQEADESLAKANSEIAELKGTLAKRDAELAAALAAKRLPTEEATAESATVLQPPEFKAESRRNSIGIDLIRIPKGEFLMGSPTTEDGRGGNEGQVRVTISQDFLLGKTEVTRGQWQQVMGTTPWSGLDVRLNGELPAVMVSWEDATEFCKKLTDREHASGAIAAGEQYRLPTEAEWEYACRAGTTTSYSFGHDDSRLGDFCWFRGNSTNQTSLVGQKEPNAWGLYDMHGNVLEWCNDFRRDYPNEAVTDPQRPSSGSLRGVRSGSWNRPAWACRSASRGMFEPFARNDYLGFRLTLSPSGVEPPEAGTSLERRLEGSQAKPTTGVNEAEQASPTVASGSDNWQAITNSIGIELKLLPAGAFTMGDARGAANERPHRVTLTRPYYIGVHEVTNAQWKRVMGSVPSKWTDNNRPVEQASWDEAVDFCLKLSALPTEKSAGRTYRLPTEAEWEYACRAGTTTSYSFGDDDSRLDNFAWFKGNSGGQTHPVGQKKPNAWGLHDMHGNVWEWCSDWSGDYATGEAKDPTGAPSGSIRVLRGGGWTSATSRCRLALREGGVTSRRDSYVGFRLAMSPSGPPSTELQGGRLDNAKPANDAEMAFNPVDSSSVSTQADGGANQRLSHSLFTQKELAVGDSVSNSLSMKLALIPAGRFLMGDPSDGDGEIKTVEVVISKPFFMGVTEVTQSQWFKLMGSTPWNRTVSVRQGIDCPAANINWFDASAFCMKLTALERSSGMLARDEAYRLPTEAEWEYACRAGSTTFYSFGNDHSKLDEYAWWGAHNGYDSSGKQIPGVGPCKDERFAHPVGLKKPNQWGLYDIYGNVWEWCGDWYSKGYIGGADPAGPPLGDTRVQRGGSWSNALTACRTHGRRPTPPDHGLSTYGFRVVLSKQTDSSALPSTHE